VSDNLLRAIARSSMAHNLQLLTLPAPAAGVDFTITPRPGEDWIVQSINATLTTSAAVPTRNPVLRMDDSNVLAWQINNVNAIGPTSTPNFSWIADQNVASPTAGGQPFTIPFPLRILQTGWRLRVVTANLDAGDQWSAVQVMFERMDEPPWRNLMIGTPEEQDLEHEISMMQQGG
jgi:hypothetical protein